MKKVLFLIGISICISLSVALSDQGSPTSQATEFYHDGLSMLTDQSNKLNEISLQYAVGKSSFEELAEQVSITRLAFKKIEVLVEYFDPQMIYDKVNGPPLPKIERKAPNLVIFPPKGLQRLDEIAADASEVDEEELLKLCKELLESVKQVEELQKKVKIYDRHIFEACRKELIRSFSLGLTGFDAPGTLNSVEESKVVFQSIDFLLGLYTDAISEQDQHLSEKIRNEVQAIRDALDSANFESLNRLELLRNSVNPLYADILKAQKLLNIELPHEVLPKPGPVNYSAETFFDDDFLRPGFYSQISDKDKNESLYELGEYLFFDPILSDGNLMSCASCHKPEIAFQDGQNKSMASHQKSTVARNAPGLMNSVFATRYFHDMRSHRLQSQIEHVIFSKDEFNTDYKEIISKINRSEEYVELFAKAFPYITKNRINPFSVAQAVTAYVERLHSWNSPFDKYVRQESNDLSEEAKRGFNLFMSKANCGSCHFAPTFAGLVPPLFTDSESEVLGITSTFDTINPVLDKDMGRYKNGRTKEKTEFYQRSFKTATVRNIELTAPYFHNGAFKTLEEVMHFYNKGGGSGLGIDVPYQTLASDELKLSQREMNDIIAFMKSLSDTTGFNKGPDRLPLFNDEELDARLGKLDLY
jgi:cytochrome c peroxidase